MNYDSIKNLFEIYSIEAPRSFNDAMSEINHQLKQELGIALHNIWNPSETYNIAEVEYLDKILTSIEKALFDNDEDEWVSVGSLYINNFEPDTYLKFQEFDENPNKTHYGLFIHNLQDQRIENYELDDNLYEKNEPISHILTTLGTNTTVYIPKENNRDKRLFIQTNCFLNLKQWIMLKQYQINLYDQDNLFEKNPIFKKYVEFINNLEPIVPAQLAEFICSIEKIEYFKERKIKEIMKLFDAGNQRKKNHLISEISNQRTDINDFQNRINNLIVSLNENLEILAFYEQRENPEAEKIIHYLNKHPHITNINKYAQDKIKLDFEVPLKYYDKESAVKYRRTGGGTEICNHLLQILLDEKYELMVNNIVIFNTESFRVQLSRQNRIKEHSIPHPHLDRYECFGNHNVAIADAATNLDYFLAIEQINQAEMNLNFYDGIVINTLLDTFKLKEEYRTTKCFREIETGEYYTIKEIIEKEYTENEEA